jgi:hypothetical protein
VLRSALPLLAVGFYGGDAVTPARLVRPRLSWSTIVAGTYTVNCGLEDLRMATRTIDLAEAPRALAASRLATDFPHYGAPLVLRQNRQTETLCAGGSAYPRCAFAERTTPSSKR